LVWQTFNQSEMARSSECTGWYARKVLDTAGIVRDAMSLIDGVLSANAFHENAGLCQVDFDLPFLKSTFLAEGLQSGPEPSRARSVRRERTLDGEDRSATIPLEIRPGTRVFQPKIFS
jgi:hypothetical protein